MIATTKSVKNKVVCLLNVLRPLFLRAHSWLNWVDEDNDEEEVGLKEKPEYTRYI